MSGPPHAETTLLDYPWVVVRFRCHWCERGRDSRLAACVAYYGMRCTLQRLLSEFVAGCPWDPHDPARKPQKYGRPLPDGSLQIVARGVKKDGEAL